jgi:integrase
MASFQKRGDSWRAIIRRTGHTPQTRTFQRKSDAEAWALSVEAGLGVARLAPRGQDTTVGELLLRYAKEVSPTKSGARWEQMRLGRFVRTSSLSYLKLSRLTPYHIQQWRDKRVTEVSGESVNREFNLLSSVFTHAMKEWHMPLPANPVKAVKRPPRGKKRNRRPSAEELAKLWDEVGGRRAPPVGRGQSLVYTMWLFEFGCEAAMRLGEMTSLKWSEVNLEESWVFVAKSKNGDERYVPLTSAGQAIIAGLDKRTDTVFVVSAAVASATFRKIKERAGIADLTMHDTRHEGTTRLAQKLKNPLDLARVVGHRDLKSLMTYYDPTVQELVARLKS